ncbi:hypothetical protein C7S15_8894 (plasmid) [Burkholderia cepacia]|nr:hypothetical protein [Burkholderia cepacia]
MDNEATAPAVLADRLLTADTLPATPVDNDDAAAALLASPVDSEFTDAAVTVESPEIWPAVPVDKLATAP